MGGGRGWAALIQRKAPGEIGRGPTTRLGKPAPKSRRTKCRGIFLARPATDGFYWSARPRTQMAVLPQGRVRPVDVTGRPISSAETSPPNRGLSSNPSR